MPIPKTGGGPGSREGGGGLDIGSALDGSTVVLTLRGDLDMQTVPKLRGALADALARADGAVLVDLDDVGFIDSTGLSALLNALRRLTRAGRRLVLAYDDGPVGRMLRLTRLDGTFSVFPSAREALTALETRTAV